MRIKLAVVLALLCLGAAVQPARAQSNTNPPPTPICFSTLPFPDVLVWFIRGTGATPNSIFIDGSGKDLSGNRAQTVSALLDTQGPPGTVNLRFGFTTYPSSLGFAPVSAGGTLDLVTGEGPGQCFSPDLLSCGDFTMKLIACPTDIAAQTISTVGAQGKIK